MFLNLGKYLDITTEAKKSDIIISLGGGSLERMKESIHLYDKSYASKKILLLTGDDRSKKQKTENKKDKRIKYLQEKKIHDINIIYTPNLKSTIEEMLYIKNFMKENNYKKALVISDPPHSRRIAIISKYIQKDFEFEIALAKIDSKWWDKNRYYKNKKSLRFATSEFFKIIYTHAKFNILDKIGLEEYENKIKEYLYPIQREIEKKLVLFII